jgi:hypothetical protein
LGREERWRKRPYCHGNIHSTSLGYTFKFNYTTFSMDKQEVAKNVYEDVGTRVRGRLAYVVPTVFYQLGEHGRRAAYVRLGVGAKEHQVE